MSYEFSYGATEPTAAHQPEVRTSLASETLRELIAPLIGSRDDDEEAHAGMPSLVRTLKKTGHFVAGYYVEQAWRGHKMPDLDMDRFYERAAPASVGAGSRHRRGCRVDIPRGHRTAAADD